MLANSTPRTCFLSPNSESVENWEEKKMEIKPLRRNDHPRPRPRNIPNTIDGGIDLPKPTVQLGGQRRTVIGIPRARVAGISGSHLEWEAEDEVGEDEEGVLATRIRYIP